VIAVAVSAPAAVEAVFRDERGRALATLVRLLGDLDLAEEALQEAFVVALEHWGEGSGAGARSPPSRPRSRRR
jgi:RNA polymerase sigma-70 factor (ECF subfamily)